MHPALNLHLVGEGPPVLFIHGSAVDQSTWSIQRAQLAKKLRLLLYDRLPGPRSVEEHAHDAARLLETHVLGPATVCGSSFGGVVALELLKTRPELVRHAVILEPPIGARDGEVLTPPDFLARFDAIAEAAGGPAAGNFFLRAVLGDDAFERLPRPFRDRSAARWEAIRHDCEALLRYRVGYAELGAVTTPVTLLGGEKSDPMYRPALEALQRTLGHATLEFLPAGHMMHAEAHRRFQAILLAAAEG